MAKKFSDECARILDKLDQGRGYARRMRVFLFIGATLASSTLAALVLLLCRPGAGAAESVAAGTVAALAAAGLGPRLTRRAPSARHVRQRASNRHRPGPPVGVA